jgi:hypothetical protein
MNLTRLALAALGAFVRIFSLEVSYLPPCPGLRMSSTDIPRCTGPRKQ